MSGKYFNINYEFDVDAVWTGIDSAIDENRATYICVADGNILSLVHKNPDYRKTVNNSLFSICDSSWVPVYLKALYGFKPSQYCGSQIFKDALDSRKYKMMFMGGSSNVLQSLRDKLSFDYPEILDMCFYELPFQNVDEFDYGKIAGDVNSFSPDIVWLALGAPKQEMFAERLTPFLAKGIVIPVGAVFNFFSGSGIRRAPEWMVKFHMEFLYRIFSEPRKQLKRCYGIISSLPAIIIEECRNKKLR